MMKSQKDKEVLIGDEIKMNLKSWGGKIKENVEDRLLERGKKASDKL